MKLEKVKKIAVEKGLKPGRIKKAALIRAIQQAENNPACFETGQAAVCGQEDCLWRPDCV